ncbi:quinone-dependent dihydroorotate dehydrogenase [Pelagibacterium luteolum]|uniref:Dihydroorotate dehydrogenase (quinone) n=1 Tax=Pelagibacterium luteolum TaxID=440168 RepID=A0A1G7Y4X1_9HYPH|nr:quinone-dependent dihydroorotate dehydrogenase [Pelagibacterium luteolum]SDG91030.1 dihydroorotate oxidase A [Pelagibacterium luteolum]
MAIGDLFRNAGLQKFARDSLLKMEAETAHRATINALKLGLAPSGSPSPSSLVTSFLGLNLPNPIGMAAGFDKNAEVFAPLAKVGFGFVEIGTVTPRPQEGNPTPRVFRIPEEMGVINRLGFNNEGHAAAFDRLRNRTPGQIVGVNIGANKDTEDFVADYVLGINTFSPLADYLTVNISSPNTPGLRNLQADEALRRLLGAVLEARATQPRQTPVLLKIAPDLDIAQMDTIAAVVLASGIDGVIVSNTTISRDAVEGRTNASEAGGLSGKPLFALSTQRLAQMRQRLGPDFPIVGVGGIHSAKSAVAKFEAGANVIQLYSALVYGGLKMVDEITTGLAHALSERGLASISQLTNAAADDWAEGRGQI